MNNPSAKNLLRLSAAAALLFAASAAPFLARAQAQSKYANDTFTLFTRGDGGRVEMHVDGSGDHCWATSSADDTVGIAMGDSKCEAWQIGDDEGGFYAALKPSQISFRLDGKSYAVADSSTVKRARGLFDPLVSIEEQQNELGSRQRALGEKQRDLGAQQRDVKVKVPDMSADFQKVEADAKRLSTAGGTQSDLGDLQSEIGDLQSKLGDLQSQAGDAQSKLGDQQSDLGDQQSALGDQQSDLGDKAGHMAGDIAAKLRSILTDAVKSGAAKPE